MQVQKKQVQVQAQVRQAWAARVASPNRRVRSAAPPVHSTPTSYPIGRSPWTPAARRPAGSWAAGRPAAPEQPAEAAAPRLAEPEEPAAAAPLRREPMQLQKAQVQQRVSGLLPGARERPTRPRAGAASVLT